MALTVLLLLLLLQNAQGFCAEFLGLWRASALVIAASLRLVGLQVWKQHCWCSPAGKHSSAEGSGQSWVQRYQTRWSWWLLLALIPAKLNKSWQIANTALREYAGIFAMPTLFSTTFGTSFLWLYLKRKMLKPTAHSFSYLRSLYENIQCAKAQFARESKVFIFRCREEQGEKKRVLVFC